MYLLFVDESGTHPGPHPFVLGGIAIHEDDAARLQKVLDEVVIKHLGRIPTNLDEYEIHASELRNARRPKSETQRGSIWANIDRHVRLALLTDAYEAIVTFRPQNERQAPALFGVAVERNFHTDWSVQERERWAYEVLLGKFDTMLRMSRTQRQMPNRGLVIHDRRVGGARYPKLGRSVALDSRKDRATQELGGCSVVRRLTSHSASPSCGSCLVRHLPPLQQAVS